MFRARKLAWCHVGRVHK